MPSPFDFASNPTPSTDSLNVTDLIRMYTNLIKTLPQQQEAEIINGFDYFPLIDIHDLKLTFGGPIDILVNEFDDHIDPLCYRTVPPALVHSDPLVYDNSNAGGIAFSQPDLGIGTKFGGAAKGDDLSYIPIDGADTKPTDKLSIAFWVYVPTPEPAGGYGVIYGAGDAVTGFGIDLQGNNIFFNYRRDSFVNILFQPIPKNQWVSVIASFDSAFGGRLNVNGNIVTDTSDSGPLQHHPSKVTVFAARDTGALALNSVSVAWLTVLHGEVVANNSGNWVTDFTNGIINANPTVNSNHEIITIFPFLADFQPQTPMTSGLFVSG